MTLTLKDQYSCEDLRPTIYLSGSSGVIGSYPPTSSTERTYNGSHKGSHMKQANTCSYANKDLHLDFLFIQNLSVL